MPGDCFDARRTPPGVSPLHVIGRGGRTIMRTEGENQAWSWMLHSQLPTPREFQMRRVLLRSIVLVGVGLAYVAVQAATVSPQQADLFARKLSQITSSQPSGPRRTPFTEGELNSWFAYRAQPALPTGVSAPEVTLLGQNRLTG